MLLCMSARSESLIRFGSRPLELKGSRACWNTAFLGGFINRFLRVAWRVYIARPKRVTRTNTSPAKFLLTYIPAKKTLLKKRVLMCHEANAGVLKLPCDCADSLHAHRLKRATCSPRATPRIITEDTIRKATSHKAVKQTDTTDTPQHPTTTEPRGKLPWRTTPSERPLKPNAPNLHQRHNKKPANAHWHTG